MIPQQNALNANRPMRYLWLTWDFSNCLPDQTDAITPQLFLTLMAHPAINQIKRFTQSSDLGPDDVADWAPGLFTTQAYRSSLVDVLTQVTTQLASQLVSAERPAADCSIQIYTQLGNRHYPITTSLSPDDVPETADTIEALVQQYEAQ